ncbi:unnamed protein product [Mucor hiemalis]
MNHTHEHQAVVADEAAYHNAVDEREYRDNSLMDEYSEKPAPPPKQKFYKKKKYWIICAIQTVIVTIVAVVLALYVIFPKVAQSLMNKSTIDVTAADISFTKPGALESSVYSKRAGDDMNTTFYMSMNSNLGHTGPFSASIKFHNPVQIYYNDSYLGDIFLYNETKISGGKGQLNAITPFLIRDTNAFSSFAKTMLAVEQFKWTLKGKLDITALTRTATVDLNKEIVLNGMNGFPNVKITDFQMPGDDPNGGIKVQLGTVLESPSPIGVQLGTIKLAIGYDGVSLGDVSANGVVLQKGDNNIVLSGTLKPQNDPIALQKVGVLFSNYVAGVISNTTAIGISCAPDGVNPIGWLSEGFKTVNLNVALGSTSPLKIINSVSMGYLDLKFDPASPYSPIANAPNVTAGFQMPFGFSLNITEVSQNITLAINTTGAETANFAIMSTPFVPSVSNQAAGVINFGLNNTAIAGIAGQENIYNQFTYALTASKNYTFMVQGSATTKTNTPIGPIVLSGINFTVPTSLEGLSFLNSTATTINSLDVTGGTTSGLALAIGVSMDNPSDFSITTGDVSFNMGASGTNLGLVTLSNLTLARGANTVAAAASFDPKSSDVGQNLLSTFVMGQDNAVDISGYANSTNIASLAAGLSVVTLSSTLPGLKVALIQGSAMSVLPDTLQTSVVGVKVSIANPFTAGLSISKVSAAATLSGMPIGNIDQDISSNPFVIGGKATAQSQQLNMAMNLEPGAVALLLRTLAVQANMDTRALDALFGLGGLHVDGQEDVAVSSDLFSGFDISKYTLEAMKALKVDLSMSSTLTIGQYVNDLAFSQAGVFVSTDESVLQFIPIVGQPIVQQIVDGSVLGFESIMLSAPTETGFKVQMKGSVTKSGPMDAVISFPTPLTVMWQGKTLGSVTMANINAKANVGASFDVAGDFSIANGADMAAFSAFLINNDKFEWEITTNDVSVTALGFTFNKISLHKFVTLAGASGFKNAVTVTHFDLPSDVPGKGINLVVDTVIKNPSQVGFNLAGVQFENFFGNVDLGPLSSNGAAIFAPQASSNVPMKGLLNLQTSKEGIVAVTTIFGHYLAGQNSTLTVKGVSGSGPNGEVSWLTSAFKTLTIENVILPGPTVIPNLIPSIEMKDLQMDFTKDPWNPPTSSKNVEAILDSPFAFPLNIKQLNMKVDATYHDAKVASLDVPDNAATSNPSNVVTTSFNNVPFQVANKQLFAGFVDLLTDSPSLTFGLQGTTNAVAATAAGTLMLPNIPFKVDTTLRGFNGFNNQARIITLNVVGGAPGYVIIDLTVEMVNPSNITITVGDINFEVHMPEFSNANVGIVYMKDTTIVPGAAVYKCTMHMGEGATSAEAVSKLLTYYLTSVTVPLDIVGTPKSTPIAPLNTALSGIKLSSPMVGINAGLIQFLKVDADPNEVLNEPFLAHAVIDLHNPLDTPFTLLSVKATTSKRITCDYLDVTAGTNYVGKDVIIGSIDYVLPTPLVIPAKSTIKTDPWPVNVNHESTDVIMSTLGKYFFYNITQHASVIVGDGFAATDMYYFQNDVPYDLTIPGVTDTYNEICMADATSLSLNNTGNATTTAVPTTTTFSTTTIVATTESTAPTTTAAPEPTTAAPEPTPTEVTPAPTTEAPAPSTV